MNRVEAVIQDTIISCPRGNPIPFNPPPKLLSIHQRSPININLLPQTPLMIILTLHRHCLFLYSLCCLYSEPLTFFYVIVSLLPHFTLYPYQHFFCFILHCLPQFNCFSFTFLLPIFYSSNSYTGLHASTPCFSCPSSGFHTKFFLQPPIVQYYF